MTRHPAALVVLHWLMLLPVLAAALGGGIVPMTTHLATGVSVAALLFLRVVIRLCRHVPDQDGRQTDVLARLARAMHLLLYALLAGAVLSGVAVVVQGDFITAWRGEGPVTSTYLGLPVFALHGIVARVLLAAIALHAAASLYHHLVLRDRIFSRMWFGARPAAEPRQR